jgi:hypothetical protein
MINAIKVLLQRQSGFLQLESTLFAVSLTICKFAKFRESPPKLINVNTIYEILTEKWFLLQNIRPITESMNLTSIMVFSITEKEHRQHPVW